MTIAFRHSAGFGKRIEYWVVGLMLKQGLDVYLPLVDDDAIDALIKRPDGSFIEVQIKARSRTAGLFKVQLNPNKMPNNIQEALRVLAVDLSIVELHN